MSNMLFGFIALLVLCVLGAAIAWKRAGTNAQLKALDERQQRLKEAEDEAAWRRNTKMNMR